MLSMLTSRRLAVLPLSLVALVAALLLAACGSSKSDSGSGSAADTSASASATSATTANASADANACTKDSLSLVNDGKLTVGTDQPAYPPYFEDNRPSNGRGFESAVAFAIARQLGFAPTDVSWIVEPFNSSYAPGPRRFDFDVNEISITPARARHVDFSAPYYTAPQAIVVLKRSPSANATSLSALASTQIGVQIGTTSLDAVNARIHPSKTPKVFDDSNDVVRALKQGQVDAVVVDLPTAFYITSAQVTDAKIVGQFDAPGGDQWGALLAHNSKLTSCVSRAVNALQSSGELKRIQDQWMGAAAGAPTLQ